MAPSVFRTTLRVAFAAPTVVAMAFGVAAGAIAARAAAADFPVPKVMSDAPPDKGKWRMEMLEANGRDVSATQKQLGGEMTVCMTAAEAVSRRESANDRRKCETRVVEDSTARAIVEVSCPGDPPVRTRSTIVRAGDRTYVVATDVQGGNATSMKMRMSYAGTCAAGDSVVSLGKDSAVCQQARAKMASGEAAKQCASGGEDEARCKARLAQAQARIESLCR
jgi:hypothetical protein